MRDEGATLPTLTGFRTCRLDNREPIQSQKDLNRILNEGFYKSSAQLLENHPEGENLFTSPLNFNLALAMLMAGSQEQTLEEIACYLGLHPDNLKDQATTKALFEKLKALHVTLNRKNSETGGQISLANSLWSSADNFFLPPYKTTVAHYFSGEAKMFKDHREINQWVASKTSDMIKDFLSQHPGDSALVTTAYFKEKWLTSFKTQSSLLSNLEFKNHDGQSLQVQWMALEKTKLKVHLNATTAASRASSSPQLVILPYHGNKMQMEIILPSEKQSAANFAKQLTPESHKELLTKVQETEIDFVMPKLDLTYRVELNDALKALGISQVFTPQARLGLMTKGQAQVDKIIHQTALKVDENGTEASAATAIGMTRGLTPPLPRLVVNRPFLVFIRDIETHLIVFGGVVGAP